MNTQIVRLFKVLEDSFAFVDDKVIKRQRLLIQLFYGFILFLSIRSFTSLSEQVPGLMKILESEIFFRPLWPLFWIQSTFWEVSVWVIFIIFLASSLSAVLYGLNLRAIRICLALSFFFYLALVFSFGKIDHYFHLALIISFLLIFFPSGTEGEKKPRFSISFWYLQLFILMSYTCSGVFKYWGIIEQTMDGEMSSLSQNTLAVFCAKTMIGHNRTFVLSDFVLNNVGYWSSLLLLVGFTIELMSVFIAFIPRLHRLWGVILVFFHLGILLFIGPDFTDQIIVVIIFILMSPFYDSSKPYFSLLRSLV